MDYEVVSISKNEKHIMWKVNTTDFLCFPAEVDNPEYRKFVGVYGVPTDCPELPLEPEEK